MILIIDDDSAVRSSLSFMLKRAGYEAQVVPGPREAIEVVRTVAPDLILMDMNFTLSTTGEEGLTLLKQVKVFRPDTPVILMTAWGSIQLAVQGMQAGAFDFIPKPWNNAALLQRIETALELSTAPKETTQEQNDAFNRNHIIGRSQGLTDVLNTIARIAKTNASVLITGESGTGKELIAEAIHINSQRAKHPFVKVNLGGISQSLFESEMFGHKKGAFTDASADRIGRFEMANKGTIFLDEIGDMPADLQTRLLRVLSDGYFYRVGGTQSIKADVRVIAATNQNLEERVRQGLFREDLYHRLNVIHLQLPPLRERTEDIEALADHFLSTAASNLKTERKRLTPEALQVIRRFPFPGNVRQLENLCNWLTVMAPSQWIRPDDLPFEFKTGSGQAASEAASDVIATRAGGWTDQLAEVVRELLSRGTPKTMDELNRVFETTVYKTALEFTHGKKIEAAQKLGVGRNTLTRKLQELGLR